MESYPSSGLNATISFVLYSELWTKKKICKACGISVPKPFALCNLRNSSHGQISESGNIIPLDIVFRFISPNQTTISSKAYVVMLFGDNHLTNAMNYKHDEFQMSSIKKENH